MIPTFAKGRAYLAGAVNWYPIYNISLEDINRERLLDLGW